MKVTVEFSIEKQVHRVLPYIHHLDGFKRWELSLDDPQQPYTEEETNQEIRETLEKVFSGTLSPTKLNNLLEDTYFLIQEMTKVNPNLVIFFDVSAIMKMSKDKEIKLDMIFSEFTNSVNTQKGKEDWSGEHTFNAPRLQVTKISSPGTSEVFTTEVSPTSSSIIANMEEIALLCSKHRRDLNIWTKFPENRK